MARTADPNWLEGYSRPWNIMPSMETGRVGQEPLLGTGWASVMGGEQLYHLPVLGFIPFSLLFIAFSSLLVLLLCLI